MHYKISDIPVQERPRERLLKVGAESLSNQELLAIILKTGTNNKNVTDVAMEILNIYSDIHNLKDATIPKLMQIKGIGEVKAIELLASIELGKRIFLKEESKIGKRLFNAKEIYLNSRYLFHGKRQEYFYCFYFNNKQEFIGKKLLFKGTINKSIVHPREVFKEAYLLSASTIVCLHNHPSNDLTPSKEDIVLTSTLVSIGKLLGIPVVDHIIVSDYGYYSFYEKNKMNGD